MKKRIFVFAIILIAAVCALFASSIEYRLLCNENNLNDHLVWYNDKDEQFGINWAYCQRIEKNDSNYKSDAMRVCSFDIDCGTGTEFGFKIIKIYDGSRHDVNCFQVEYDPTKVTLLTKAVSKEIVSPTKIKAKIEWIEEVFFIANPVLADTRTYITIIGDPDYYYYTVDISVDIKTAENTQDLWYLHTPRSVSDKSKWGSDLSNYYTSIVKGMSFNPLPLEVFYLYPSTSVKRIGYAENNNLYVVKYDSKYVDCNSINTTETKNYKNLYGITENSSERIVVVNGKNGIKFTRNSNLETSYKTTTVEVVPYPFFMDSRRSTKVVLDVGKWEKIEMSKDKTTRLYGVYPYEVMVSKSNHDIKTRGLAVGDNEITVSWNNFNTTRHQYHYYLETLNYKNSISAFSGYINTSTGDQRISERFALNLSSSAFRHEDYLNNEEVKIRLHALDVTDKVEYYYDFEYPLEDFEPNYWSISDFTTATNGDVNTGTLVDTKVCFDFRFNATTPQDQFDRGYIVIYDSTRTKVYSTSFDLYRSNGATSGTLTSGWGKNTLFSYLNFYFYPKSVGRYYVDIYGWNYYGNYNVGKYSTTFNVSK